jgi:hypothetical protein
MKKHKVAIILSEGLVHAVYGTSADIEVSVVNLDADDPEEYEEVRKEYEKIFNEMICIW